MQNFTLKVVQVTKPVLDVVTIGFKQPGLKKVKYKAGQYLTLIVRINGRKYIRPYSLSSAPVIDSLLEVTVKRIPGGIVSNYLYDHIKVDDTMEVMEPMGDFVYEGSGATGEEHIMLWGAGSGVTPLLSILKTSLHTNPVSSISLFYCNRNPEHTIFRQEIADLQTKYDGRFTIWNFYTGIPEDIFLNYGIIGRINEEKILSVITDTGELTRSKHYICGPQGLKDTVKGILTKYEVPAKHVFSEEFEVLIDPEQFDEVETQTISIRQGNDALQVEVIKGKSILDAGLDALLDLSYSCQTGTCMLCKAKLAAGSVKVIGVEVLPPEVEADECLMCCSYPLTNDVEIFIA